MSYWNKIWKGYLQEQFECPCDFNEQGAFLIPISVISEQSGKLNWIFYNEIPTDYKHTKFNKTKTIPTGFCFVIWRNISLLTTSDIDINFLNKYIPILKWKNRQHTRSMNVHWMEYIQYNMYIHNIIICICNYDIRRPFFSLSIPLHFLLRLYLSNKVSTCYMSVSFSSHLNHL